MNEPSAGKSGKKTAKRPIQPFHPNYDYEVDYNDHFETPLQAYRDILPVLDAVAPGPRQEHKIYDPYYCNGRTKRLLQDLGFSKTIHHKRDFYKDIACGKVPHHHTLVTNPPYSDDHKEKCLDYCVKNFRKYSRPFFLLIPNYVAARNYYRRIVGETLQDVAYVLPHQEYSYSHPEGTGHEESPFGSLWFCCIGRDKIHRVAANYNNYGNNNNNKHGPQFIQSFDDLVQKRIISLQNRPNPKQRKKMRKLAAQPNAGTSMAKSNHHKSNKNNSHNNNSNNSSNNNSRSRSKPPKEIPKKKKTKSKYRSTKTGERTKKRF